MDLTASSILPIDETCGRHATSLTDLPNELLDTICRLAPPLTWTIHHIDKNDTDIPLCLASLCSRLHSIALPIYFARLGFYGSSLRLGYSSGMIPHHVSRLLKGIRLSFSPFLQNITSLTCQLGRYPSDDLSGILNLLDYVHAVSDIHVQFRRGKYRALAPEFFSILAALGKKQCKSLHIVDLPGMYYERTRTPEFRPCNILESLSIQVDGVPPEVLHWIVASINSSPLRTLKLCIGNQQDLVNLLSQSTAPYLTELWAIYPIPINETITFLSRHPGITRLHISGKDLPQKLDTYGLMHLTSLSAPPALVALLLSQPGRAPNLTFIHLFTDGSYDAWKSWETMYHDDETELMQSFAVLQSYPRITNLSLTLFKRLGNMEWVGDMEKASIDGLRQIRMLKVYSEPQFFRLLPNFIQSLHHFIPVMFPHLNTLTVDVPETIVVEKRIVRQLCAVCPTLLKISFSRDVPATSVAPYL